MWLFDIKISYCEGEGDLDSLGILVGVPHVSVDSTKTLVVMFSHEISLLTMGRHYGRQKALEIVSITSK
jgi:hypothetical protein